MNDSKSKKMQLIVAGIAGLIVISMIIYYSTTNDKDFRSFRGITWETNLNTLHGMDLIAQQGNIKFCSKQNEVLKIYDIDTDNIIYGFYKDQFYSAFIYFGSISNFNKLKELFIGQYGNPVQPNNEANKYFWNIEPVKLLLTYDESSNKGRISYSYGPIEDLATRE